MADYEMGETKGPRWHWRNCRDIGLYVFVHLTDWAFGAEACGDVYGMTWRICLGPIGFDLRADIGNCSSENRFKAWIGLSMAEAEARALAWEGRKNG